MKTDFKISGSFNLSHYGHLTWRRKPLGRRLCSEFVLKIHIFRVFIFFFIHRIFKKCYLYACSGNKFYVSQVVKLHFSGTTKIIVRKLHYVCACLF